MNLCVGMIFPLFHSLIIWPYGPDTTALSECDAIALAALADS